MNSVEERNERENSGRRNREPRQYEGEKKDNTKKLLMGVKKEKESEGKTDLQLIQL